MQRLIIRHLRSSLPRAQAFELRFLGRTYNLSAEHQGRHLFTGEDSIDPSSNMDVPGDYNSGPAGAKGLKPGILPQDFKK